MKNIRYVVYGLLMMGTSAVFALEFKVCTATSYDIEVFPVYTGGPRFKETLKAAEKTTKRD